MPTNDDNGQTKRVKMIKSNGGREVAARPVGRPQLGESQDRYGDQVAEHCRDEIERLVELTVANRLRTRFRYEQQKIERRIDRLLGQEQDDE